MSANAFRKINPTAPPTPAKERAVARNSTYDNPKKSSQ
jgi:hypothetical protein